TGYVNFLSEEEKRDVLRWAREALGAGVPFVAGAYIECQDGEVVALYRKQIDAIVAHGGIPILFQTSRLQGKTPADKGEVYAAAGLSHLYRKRSGHRHDRVRIRLFARAGHVCTGEVCGAGPPLGRRGSRVLCAVGCPATSGKHCVSRSRSGVQTFDGGVSSSHGKNSDESDASEKREAARMGGGDSSRLRASRGGEGESTNERSGP